MEVGGRRGCSCRSRYGGAAAARGLVVERDIRGWRGYGRAMRGEGVAIAGTEAGGCKAGETGVKAAGANLFC